MVKVVGIDLGTTNSVIAVVEGGNSIVIPNNEGSRTTPSVVAYSKNKELLVGQIAKRQNIINPENTFYSVKRFIGSKTSEIKNELKQVSYKIIEDTKGNVKIACPILEKEFSPEEISSQVLRKLSLDANKFLNQQVSKAVITVPAYFNDSQRQATKDAGKIAGLEVVRIINEPTAAALAYGLDKKNNETILIFDLGGGTFDVSILEVGEGVFEVLSTSGDSHLGGDDFDNVLLSYILKDFKEKEGITLDNDKQAVQRVLEAAEKAKVELSNLYETTVNLPYITADQTGPKHIDLKITRANFEQLAANLITRCQYPVNNALKDAKIQISKLNEVILVGGSTRIPAVQNLVQELTNKTPNLSVNPDEVVALGAAINGAIIAGDITNVILLDVTPLSLGIETLGGIMTPMIPRNTNIPTKKTEIFSTAEDNQSIVEIHILQGERKLAADNKSLGTFRLSNIAPAPRAVPQIEVTFDLNVDGILSVSAKDQGTGKSQSLTINNASTLDKSEVERIIQEAEINAQVDLDKKKHIELKNNADILLYRLKQKLTESKEKLNETDLKEIENYIEELTTIKNSENYEQLEILLKQSENILAKL